MQHFPFRRLATRTTRSAAFGSIVIALATAARAAQSACDAQIASVSSEEAQAIAYMGWPGISANGRYVAFTSTATNFVPNDTNFAGDVFVRDLFLGKTERVDVASNGAQANFGGGEIGLYFPAAISGDGRYVAFASSSNNLVAGDTNGTSDVFLRDRVAGTTQRVSLLNSGAQGSAGSDAALPSISDDGRFVAFEGTRYGSEGNDIYQCYVRDRQLGTTVRISSTSTGTAGNQDSEYAAISGDGSAVVFLSYADDLVANDTNVREDVFVWTRATGAVERVNVTTAGVQANCPAGGCDLYPASISDDGRYVAFNDAASTLSGGSGVTQIYVRDRVAGTTTRVSNGWNGSPVAPSYNAMISGDGRWVAFDSPANNAVQGDVAHWDVFVVDRINGGIQRWSQTASGQAGQGDSYFPALTPDGRALVFQSGAPNLAAGDIDESFDILVRECGVAPAVYCPGKVNSQSCQASIAINATPSASAASACTISSTSVINNRSGLLLYGLKPQARTLSSGMACFMPIRRVGSASSGGNAGADDCSGTFAYDINARIQSGLDPLLVPGAIVSCQYWYRDGGATALSAALRFQIAP